MEYIGDYMPLEWEATGFPGMPVDRSLPVLERRPWLRNLDVEIADHIEFLGNHMIGCFPMASDGLRIVAAIMDMVREFDAWQIDLLRAIDRADCPLAEKYAAHAVYCDVLQGISADMASVPGLQMLHLRTGILLPNHELLVHDLRFEDREAAENALPIVDRRWRSLCAERGLGIPGSLKLVIRQSRIQLSWG